MAYTAPTTRVANELIDQADWNTDVTDNITWLGTSHPHAQAYKSVTSQSLNNTTYTVITFDSEAFDTGSCHSTSSNTGRLTVPANSGGLYEIYANLVFTSNATGFRYGEFYLNGATAFGVTALGATNGTVTSLQMYTQKVLAAADYVELRGYQNSGGGLTIVGTAAYTYFGFRWIATA